MAHHGRGVVQQRMTRQSSLVDAENKGQALMASTKGAAGLKPAMPGAAGGGLKGLQPRGAPNVHRRALSEVGNVVDAAGGKGGAAMDKENIPAKPAGLPAGAAKPMMAKKQQQQAGADATNSAVPAPAPAAAKRAAAATAASAATASTATVVGPTIPGLPDVARLANARAASTSGAAESADVATSSVTSAASQHIPHAVPEHAKAPAPGPAAFYALHPSAAGSAACNKEEEEECAMSLTSSLTAFSEEACGEADMMEAEETLPDIDWEDRENPIHVTQYVEDIYAFYRRTEKQGMVQPTYMAQQRDVNDKMRAILIDWLVEVHLKFKLMPETLYLTTNLIDRYLAITPVTRRNLQLVGVTAMLVASKYEEIWAPEVKDFVYISDNAYNRDQILSTEKHMLNSLKFNLTVPTPYVFAARFIKAAAAGQGSKPSEAFASNKETFNVAWYLLELCLPEYSMLQYPPSHLAAAAVYTALLRQRQQQHATGHGQAALTKSSSSNSEESSSLSSGAHTPPIWTKLLERHSGYTEGQLLPCVEAMVQLQHKAPGNALRAVHKKYSQPKFSEVAKIVPLLPPSALSAPPAQLAAPAAGSKALVPPFVAPGHALAPISG